MPTKRLHKKLDDKLKEEGILYDDTISDSVHSRMDKGVKWYGALHREEDYYHSEEGVRDWLSGFEHLASQGTLTDLLRSGLAHKVLDDIESRGKYRNENDLISRAFRSFKARGYDRKYYKKRK